MSERLTDEQLRWLYETARAAGDVSTARAAIAAQSVSEIVASRWTKETAMTHCVSAFAMLVRGAQECREMMARFVEYAGDATTAMSIRANWNPIWGKDPGRPKANDDSGIIRCNGGAP